MRQVGTFLLWRPVGRPCGSSRVVCKPYMSRAYNPTLGMVVHLYVKWANGLVWYNYSVPCLARTRCWTILAYSERVSHWNTTRTYVYHSNVMWKTNCGQSAHAGIPQHVTQSYGKWIVNVHLWPTFCVTIVPPTCTRKRLHITVKPCRPNTSETVCCSNWCVVLQLQCTVSYKLQQQSNVKHLSTFHMLRGIAST
jgi:hypothetical protein